MKQPWVLPLHFKRAGNNIASGYVCQAVCRPHAVMLSVISAGQAQDRFPGGAFSRFLCLQKHNIQLEKWQWPAFLDALH